MPGYARSPQYGTNAAAFDRRRNRSGGADCRLGIRTRGGHRQPRAGDWVWSALETLSEPLQEVVLLRYFTSASSYHQVAAACDVPVGTVRSRLNQARTRLDQALRATVSTVHTDIDTRVARRREAAEALPSSAPLGQFRTALADATVPDLRLVGPQGQRSLGREALADMMDSDLRAGVRQRLNSDHDIVSRIKASVVDSKSNDGARSTGDIARHKSGNESAAYFVPAHELHVGSLEHRPEHIRANGGSVQRPDGGGAPL